MWWCPVVLCSASDCKIGFIEYEEIAVPKYGNGVTGLGQLSITFVLPHDSSSACPFLYIYFGLEGAGVEMWLPSVDNNCVFPSIQC
jgi:hypothetical protein